MIHLYRHVTFIVTGLPVVTHKRAEAILRAPDMPSEQVPGIPGNMRNRRTGTSTATYILKLLRLCRGTIRYCTFTLRLVVKRIH